jgi:DHA1 family multidrug/chloramphenicol efflux transport protein-like MFS transporter
MKNITPLIDITKRNAILYAFFLVVYEFLTYISNDMIMPGMQQVVEHFHVASTEIPNAVTAFMLGGASLQIFLGPLSDALGRKKVMLLGVFVFFISTFFLSISQNMHAFLIERFFQGMGICFIGAIGYATLQEMFDDIDAVKLTAIMSSLTIIAPLMGPLLGSFVVIHAGWRMIFTIVAALTAIAWWGLSKYMPETVGVTKRNGEVIQKQGLSVTIALNNYAELIKNKPFIFSIIMYGLMGTPCMIWIALSPVMIIADAHHSLYEYSLWQIPMFSSFLFANTLLQRWTERFNLQQLMEKGIYVIIINLILSPVLYATLNNQYLAFIPIFVGYFFGYAVASAPMYRLMFGLSKVAKGTTAAMISLCIMLIQSLGIELGNLIYHHHHYEGLSLLLAGIGLIIMALAYFVIRHKQLKEMIS